MLLAILHFVVFMWLLVFIGFNIILNLYLIFQCMNTLMNKYLNISYLIFQCMNTLMNKYLNLLLRFIFMVRYMDTRKVVIVAARNVMVLIARGGMRINGMHGWIGC